MENEVIVLPTDEERKEFLKRQNELTSWVLSLTKEQIDFLCDQGIYNDAIRGYLIVAASFLKLPNEQIMFMLQCLEWAFDEKNKADAEHIYQTFWNE